MDFIMSFIKRYIALAVPVAIILAAVLVYVPTTLIGGSIKKEIDRSSLAQGKKIESLLRGTKPEQQWQMEKDYQDRHHDDAGNIRLYARQSTLRELIRYGIFPEPKDKSQQLFNEFGLDYQDAIVAFLESMNALDAPSKIDIERELGTKLTSTKSRSQNKAGRKKQTAAEKKRDVVCCKRAELISVYANPGLFKWYDFWDYWPEMEFPGSKKAVEHCWHSQVAYWIYEDVVDTINALNAGSQSVSTSSVKRLLGVSFQRELIDEAKAKKKGNVQATTFFTKTDKPEYVLDEEKSIMDIKPWTGRKSDKSNIDVVHFSIAVVVGAKQVLPFMQELCSEKEHTYRRG